MSLPSGRYCTECGACVGATDTDCFACGAPLRGATSPYRHHLSCELCGTGLGGKETVCPGCGVPRHRTPSERARCNCEPDGPAMIAWNLLDPAVTVHSCPLCGASHVDRADWLTLVGLLQPRKVNRARLPYEVRRRPLGERYGERDDRRPCPVCREPTERRNLAAISGVLVQHCVDHGFFFPAGQLHAAMEFVRTGGMSLARARGLLRAGEIPEEEGR